MIHSIQRPTRRRKHTHPIQTILITTAQIQSVVGDQLDSRGEVVRLNSFCKNHWIKGLHSTAPHRWRIGFGEVVYGDVESPEPYLRYTSDAGHATKNGMELWNRLVEAVEVEYRKGAIAS